MKPTMNFAQIMAENRNSIIKQNAKQKKVENKIWKLSTTDLSELVGDATVTALLEHGISTKKELLEISQAELKKIKLNPFSMKAIKSFLTENKENDWK